MQKFAFGDGFSLQKFAFENRCDLQKSIFLNNLNTSYDYSKLSNVNKIYIPLKYFSDTNFRQIINTLSTKGKIYIYMPNIVKDNFVKHTVNNIDKAFKNFDICGIVVSNLSELNIIKKANISKDIELIANYTFNVFNKFSINTLYDLGFTTITLSPELDAESFSKIISSCGNVVELISYSNIPLMSTSYCLLGKSNKCYKDCKRLCDSSNKFYLKDRYNFKFRVIPDNEQTITTIYNSRTTKIDYATLNVKNVRFDIFDETIDEINRIIL